MAILKIKDANGNVSEVLAFNGKDGASITITDISESTENGGSNIITFSDGSSITIKNGADYQLTEEDKTDLAEMTKEEIVSAPLDYIVLKDVVTNKNYKLYLSDEKLSLEVVE